MFQVSCPAVCRYNHRPDLLMFECDSPTIVEAPLRVSNMSRSFQHAQRTAERLAGVDVPNKCLLKRTERLSFGSLTSLELDASKTSGCVVLSLKPIEATFSTTAMILATASPSTPQVTELTQPAGKLCPGRAVLITDDMICASVQSCLCNCNILVSAGA